MIVVLALSVGAPGLFAPAGAADVHGADRIDVQWPTPTRVELVAKHVKRKAHRRAHVKKHKPMTAAMKKAKLVSYIKAHPGVVAGHTKKSAAHKVKPAKGHYLAGPAKKKKPAAKKKPHAKKAVHKKKKKKSSGTGLKRTAMLLVLLSIGGIGLFLVVSSLRNAPRARARARARKRAQPLPSS